MYRIFDIGIIKLFIVYNNTGGNGLQNEFPILYLRCPGFMVLLNGNIRFIEEYWLSRESFVKSFIFLHYRRTVYNIWLFSVYLFMRI